MDITLHNATKRRNNLKFLLFFLGIISAAITCNARAEANQTQSQATTKTQYGLSVASGYGASRIAPLRVGVQKYWERSWRDTKTIAVHGYWDASLYHMRGNGSSEPSSNKTVDAVALTGTFRFEGNAPLEESGHIWPFLDLGFGGSYFSKTEISGRTISIHFQFEEHIGAGARFGLAKQYELGYRFAHFSNAYLGDYNHGINLHMLVFSYWL
jgi:lipid A 3-O-deacylase